MKVFCVLFLVLLNTIGNQGDPNELPMNIVSMRNNTNHHICTGSIISRKLILSSLSCVGATHFLHGLREYENCSVIQRGKYRNITVVPLVTRSTILYKLCAWLPVPKEEGWKTRPKCKHESVNEPWGRRVKRLLIPRHPDSKFNQTGEVLGWSFDNSTRKFVMNKIGNISTEQAFSNATDVTFFRYLCVLGTGSPLIATRVIYGFLSCSRPYHFDNILADVELIKTIINFYS